MHCRSVIPLYYVLAILNSFEQQALQVFARVMSNLRFRARNLGQRLINSSGTISLRVQYQNCRSTKSYTQHSSIPTVVGPRNDDPFAPPTSSTPKQPGTTLLLAIFRLLIVTNQMLLSKCLDQPALFSPFPSQHFKTYTLDAEPS